MLIPDFFLLREKGVLEIWFWTVLVS